MDTYQGNDTDQFARFDTLERMSHLGTSDADTEAQTSTPVNYGSSPSGEPGSYEDGVDGLSFRTASVPIGAGEASAMGSGTGLGSIGDSQGPAGY